MTWNIVEVTNALDDNGHNHCRGLGGNNDQNNDEIHEVAKFDEGGGPETSFPLTLA